LKLQFYTPNGQYIRTLKVPGTGINGITWEGSGLRLALAVDSFVYFANVRPVLFFMTFYYVMNTFSVRRNSAFLLCNFMKWKDYRWGYFSDTLVYAFSKPDRTEHCTIFWNTKTGDFRAISR